MRKNSKRRSVATTKLVCGQTSWRLATGEVEAFVTEMGGHLGPVTFHRRDQKTRPYSVAPWAEERHHSPLPPVIKALRGDFFCLPFGGNSTPFRGEQHPVHGETANARWRFEALNRHEGGTSLHLSLKTKIRPGRVDKRIFLLDGQNNVYCEHLVSGMNGPTSFGHHAMLGFPDAPESGVLSTSRFVYAQVFPQPFELPEKGGYSCLKTGAEFNSLQTVPTATGGTADLTRYPARRGFEDLVILVSDADLPFAWTAVAFPKQGYVWFALKNPRVLRQTVLWISNGGRHYAPWSGRHVNVMGLEEVTSYFHLGLAESVANNHVSEKGYPTHLVLSSEEPLAVRYIMGVAKVPGGFDHIVSIRATQGNQAIAFQSASGKQIESAVRLDFLEGRPIGETAV